MKISIIINLIFILGSIFLIAMCFYNIINMFYYTTYYTKTHRRVMDMFEYIKEINCKEFHESGDAEKFMNILDGFMNRRNFNIKSLRKMIKESKVNDEYYKKIYDIVKKYVPKLVVEERNKKISEIL